MRTKSRLMVFIALLIVLLTGLSCLAETYSAIRTDYNLLLSSTERQRQRLNWEQLLHRFDRFIAENPLADTLEKAMFLQAQTWNGLSKVSGRDEDAREAVNRFIAMADRFPRSRLADDALYHAGQALEFRLDDTTAARRCYQRLLSALPHGDMAAAAAERVRQIPGPDKVDNYVSGGTTQGHQLVGQPLLLENIRYWSGPLYTRIVFDLNAPVVAEPHLLNGSDPRLYFDLLYTQSASAVPEQINVNNGLVNRIRTGMFDESRTRVVIDLGRVAEYRLTTLNNPERLVIDVLGAPMSRNGSAPDTHSALVAASAEDDSIASVLDSTAEQDQVLHLRQQDHSPGIHLIVVDAGHGGRDPGAIGPGKTREKDVTLALAKVLARELRQKMGVKVLLTRDDDRFLELRERTDYANRVGADLFVSLHANASHSGKAYGLETYFLNLAKNNQAAEVAARENGTSLQDVGNLEAILFDLMANAKINESSRLAAEVQHALVTELRPHYQKIKDLGVKQGPFHVLLGATMPSVLVEAAFISHPREEKRLASQAYQQRVATAVVKGIMRYSATIDQVVSR